MAGTTKNAFLLNDLNLDSLNHVLGVVQREVDRLTGLLGEIIFRDTIEAPITRVTNKFLAAAGTAALPSYSFTADTDTGLFWSAADTLGFSTGGTSRLTISSLIADFDVTLTASPIVLEAAAGSTGELRFTEKTGNGVNYVGLKAPASISSNKVWILPSADGTSGQVLSTDGALTLSWATGATITYGSPVSIDIGDAASDGVATTVSRSDHQHAFTAPSAGYPVDVAATEADGSATTPARSDHVHALGIGTTKADLLARSSTVWARLAVGTDAQVLTADSAQTLGVKWATPSAGGETNTASNVGTSGVGVFHQKTGVDLEFKKLQAGAGYNQDSWGGVTVENETTTNTLMIETEEMQWEHSHNLWEMIGQAGHDYNEETGLLWIMGALGIQVGASTQVTAVNGAFNGQTENDTAGTSSQFTLSRGRVGPAAILSGDSLGALSWRGHTGSAYTGSKAFTEAAATENWSSTANGTKFTFRTTANTTTTLTTRMTIDNDGNIAMSNSTPATSAKLDMVSTTGALLVPRMTTAQRDALTPIAGMIVYNTTTGFFNGYQATGPAWLAM